MRLFRFARNDNVFLYLALLLFMISTPAYALDLDPLKADLMSGDYRAAITRGEKMLASAGNDRDADALYYILGLSYLKDGNFLRASDIFEIIINELKSSRYAPQARLGLSDTYFFRGDFQKAKNGYLELLAGQDALNLKAVVYSRLSQCEAKLGNTAAAKDYLDRLSREFPLNVEPGWEAFLLVNNDFYYSVQVGSFASKANAENLIRRLERSGYSAFIEEAVSQGAPVYRVRSGKLASRQEALELEARLSAEGYPTKIFP